MPAAGEKGMAVRPQRHTPANQTIFFSRADRRKRKAPLNTNMTPKPGPNAGSPTKEERVISAKIPAIQYGRPEISFDDFAHFHPAHKARMTRIQNASNSGAFDKPKPGRRARKANPVIGNTRRKAVNIPLRVEDSSGKSKPRGKIPNLRAAARITNKVGPEEICSKPTGRKASDPINPDRRKMPVPSRRNENEVIIGRPSSRPGLRNSHKAQNKDIHGCPHQDQGERVCRRNSQDTQGGEEQSKNPRPGSSLLPNARCQNYRSNQGYQR